MLQDALYRPQNTISLSDLFHHLLRVFTFRTSKFYSVLLNLQSVKFFIEHFFIPTRMQACCIASALCDLVAVFAIDMPKVLCRESMTSDFDIQLLLRMKFDPVLSELADVI